MLKQNKLSNAMVIAGLCFAAGSAWAIPVPWSQTFNIAITGLYSPSNDPRNVTTTVTLTDLDDGSTGNNFTLDNVVILGGLTSFTDNVPGVGIVGLDGVVDIRGTIKRLTTDGKMGGTDTYQPFKGVSPADFCSGAPYVPYDVATLGDDTGSWTTSLCPPGTGGTWSEAQGGDFTDLGNLGNLDVTDATQYNLFFWNDLTQGNAPAIDQPQANVTGFTVTFSGVCTGACEAPVPPNPGPAPAPGSLALLGLGLAGLAGLRRRQRA